jgi:FkbM family methyltransferase
MTRIPSETTDLSTLLARWRSLAPARAFVIDATVRGAPWAGGVRPFASVEVARAADGNFEPLLASRRRADLLIVDAADTLRRHKDLFFRNRVDAVLFPGDPGCRDFLGYFQFDVYGSEPALAVHPRFYAPVLPGNRHLDLPALFKRFALEARGVIHIGGHEGQELELYQRMGFRRILFVEANPAVFGRLSARVANKPGVAAVLCAASDKNGVEILRVTSNDECSSLLPLKDHAALYPAIVETHRVPVAARRLDHLLAALHQSPADYNFLHLDIQGAELQALRGAADTLPRLDALSTEVNYAELYEGCPQVEDLDDFLGPLGFQRMVTATPMHPPWGDAFYVRRPAVSMRMLGQWGRFGNQVFEYAFVHVFAREHGLAAETAPWVGNQLFGADDPVPRRPFPQHLEKTYSLADSRLARPDQRPANLDVCGVFQYHTAFYAPHRAAIRALFRPVPALKELLDAGLGRVRARGRTVVALHLRRGDYGYGMFFVAPASWYLRWLEALWPTLDAPVLYIASDEPEAVAGEFAHYAPMTAKDLHIPSFGADFYPDFYLLSQADAVAISNSSFSFAACMLNERAGTFTRPDLFARRLVPFDPWNAEPLLHRELGLVDPQRLSAVVGEYRRRPNDPGLLATLRDYRNQVAESWSLIPDNQVATAATTSLWTCYTLLAGTDLCDLPFAGDDAAVFSRVSARHPSGRGAGALGPWLALSLYVPARNRLPVDVSAAPEQVRPFLRRT